MLSEEDKAKRFWVRKGYKYRYPIDVQQKIELEEQGYVCIQEPDWFKSYDKAQKPKKQVSINKIEEGPKDLEELYQVYSSEELEEQQDTKDEELEAKLTVNKPKRRK